ncbi:MAG: hypothetical protein OEW11_04670 [Nitrospirota bacterium]|nr:hypothetical protein [Nitrospirota bacterium]
MAVGETFPPRPPRPGDPFATLGEHAQAGPTPPRVPRKKGRTFFLVLLFTGAALALASLILFFTGRSLLVGFYRDYTVQRSIPEALAADVQLDDARHLIHTLDTFFARADRRELPDPLVLDMIQRIDAVLSDRVITRAEVVELETLAGQAALLTTGTGSDTVSGGR